MTTRTRNAAIRSFTSTTITALGPSKSMTFWPLIRRDSCDSEAAAARRDLGQLVQMLPDKQRLPIEYVKLEGLSVVETARITGLSESAVKIGVHRGLKALAAKIRGMA